MRDPLHATWQAITRLGLLLLCVPLAGCDPIFDLGGAYFPSWLAVVLGGIGTVICIRWILDRTGIESFLGPRGLVYICMFMVFSIIYWFIFFET